jgi:hypothetical protein
VLQAVAAHLRQHEFSYAVTSGGDGLLFTMAEDGLSWSSAVHVIEDKQMLRIVARLPLFVPVAGRREATALLARLNFGNLVGSWQMDPADGETIYVTTHIFADGYPSEDTMKTLMMITAMSLAREGPRILRLIQRPARLPKTSPDPARN